RRQPRAARVVRDGRAGRAGAGPVRVAAPARRGPDRARPARPARAATGRPGGPPGGGRGQPLRRGRRGAADQPAPEAVPRMTAHAPALAMLGGPRAVPRQTAGGEWPIVTAADREAVLRVLDSGRLVANADGEREVPALEREWAERTGVAHCLAVA